MHRLAMALVMMTAISCAGLAVAEAMALSGGAQPGTSVKSLNSVTPAACKGGGEHCPPGYIWNGNKCVPC
jgi:hypothetical protein